MNLLCYYIRHVHYANQPAVPYDLCIGVTSTYPGRGLLREWNLRKSYLCLTFVSSSNFYLHYSKEPPAWNPEMCMPPLYVMRVQRWHVRLQVDRFPCVALCANMGPNNPNNRSHNNQHLSLHHLTHLIFTNLQQKQPTEDLEVMLCGTVKHHQNSADKSLQ